jgi:hypothetical protein
MRFQNFNARERQDMSHKLKALADTLAKMADNITDPENDVSLVVDLILFSTGYPEVARYLKNVLEEETAIRNATKGLDGL